MNYPESFDESKATIKCEVCGAELIQVIILGTAIRYHGNERDGLIAGCPVRERQAKEQAPAA